MQRHGIIRAVTLAVVGLACAGVKKGGTTGGGGSAGNVFTGAAGSGSGGNPFGDAATAPPPDGGTGSRSDGGMLYPLQGTITADGPTTLTVSGKPTTLKLGVKM